MVVTNLLGVAFTATLMSVSDAGPTFVFPEDGATNTLTWSQLSPASYRMVCAAAKFTPVPPALRPVYRMAEAEQARLAALEADGRLAPDEAARRRVRLQNAFRKACRKRGLSAAEIESLLRRLAT